MEWIQIAAVSANGVIGEKGQLPWHLPRDLKHFKDKTKGAAVLMGRKTAESIGKPLPGRLNLVLSTKAEPNLEHFDGLKKFYYHSSFEVLDRFADEHSEAKTGWIVGGGEIYKLTEKVVQRIELTRIHQEFDGDAYFPMQILAQFQLKQKVPFEENNLKGDFETWLRL